MDYSGIRSLLETSPGGGGQPNQNRLVVLAIIGSYVIIKTLEVCWH